MSPHTRWFELSGRELRVLIIAAAIVMLMLTGLGAVRRLMWQGEVKVSGSRDSLELPVRIDINLAEDYELQLIPGIGEVTARAIVEDRDANGYFRDLNDLMRVKGIGPKTIESIRPHVMCSPPLATD